MSRKLYKFFAVAVAISLIVALPAVALPQSSPADSRAPLPTAPQAEQAAPQAEEPTVSVDVPQVELPEALQNQTGPVKIVIELADEPAAVVYATALEANKSATEATTLTRVQLARIDAAQAALQPALDAAKATVLYRTQRVYNGIYAIVDGDKLNELAKQPGIKAIHPLVSKAIDNASSVPLIGAPQLWDAGGPFAGLDGTDIKIGVIDTGLDYIHADFGGPAVNAAYLANDTTIITDRYVGELLFPTTKAVGGWDFAGDSYNADPADPAYQPIPHPDPDPMDCNGHGSHVSGTATGYGVNADGSTYTGVYTSGMNFTPFKIGPGVAPKASLYALRVFGCAGSTDLTDQAIEWAMDPDGNGDFSDHLDVINMSLGSSYGSPYDSSAVATNNAAAAGVIVVTSAGNSGDVYYVTGAPGIAERAISTAASDDGGSVVGGFRVNSPAAIVGVYYASEASFGPNLDVTGPLTRPLAYPSDGGQNLGCATFNITNTQLISGNIALIDRGTCTFAVKVKNAQLAGAAGALIVNNVVGAPGAMGGTDPTIVIPSMMTDLATGNLIKTYLPGTPVNATLTSEYRNLIKVSEPALVNTIGSFSSRGPRRGDSLLKPDITAPGVTVFSVANGTGTAGTSFNGTSMASPHVAGSMALLKQLHPDWTVAELKSLVMNTATTDITQPNGAAPKYGPGRVGAGRVTLPNAASSQAIAFNASEPYLTSVSFGAPEVIGTATATKYIKVVNKGTAPVNYAVSYANYVDIPGVAYTVTPSSITLPAHGEAQLKVVMTADASQMTHTRDATVSSASLRQWLSEEAGYVVLTPYYTLATNTVGNGSITVTPNQATYAPGTVVTLTATAGTGSSFVSWSGDMTSTDNPLVLTITSDMNLTANFGVNAYSVMVYTVGGGSVSKDPDEATYAYGSVVTLTAVPDAAFFFDGWSGDATGTANPFVLTVDGNKVVTATFTTHLVYLPLVAKSGSGAVAARTSSTPAAPTASSMPVTLRVPIYSAPRPASTMDAVQTTVAFTAVTGTATINLQGTGIGSLTAYPTSTLSLISGFELAESSPNNPSTVGLENNADLKYVGVTNDFRTAGYVTSTVIFFGIATWGNHSTATYQDARFDIYIDTNRDGTDDYLVRNINTGTSSSPTDVFVTAVYSLTTGSGFADRYTNYLGGIDTAVWNNNLLILPVNASRLGLTTANPRFNYYVRSYSRDSDSTTYDDTTTVHTYSAAAAGLDFTGGVGGNIWADLPGGTMTARLNQVSYAANGSLGALLFHHHNAFGAREEVLNVTSTAVAISIMHHNDFHGQLEPAGSNPGYARDVAVVNQVRNQIGSANAILLDAGDEMQGSLLSNANKGAPVIDLFSFAGVKAATFGNHEFDWGQQTLISRTQQATYPFVTANIVVSSTGNCANETGWTTPSFAKPWITTTVGSPGNQVVVGIVGVTTLETPQITIASATQGLCFKDPAVSISHYVPIMKAAGAQVIVVLSHLGYPEGGYGYGIPVYGDQTLARKLVEAGQPANLIIGGHSHTNLAAATVVSGTTIVQAYYNGRNIGRADLVVDKTSGAVTINWQRISVSTSGPEDAAAKTRIAMWANDPVYQALINQPIGYTQVDLPRGNKTEAMMADFVDDAIYNYLNTDGTTANDVDMFFNNAGGIRTDWCRIPNPSSPGQYIWSSAVADCHAGVYTDTPMLLTYGNMFNILPFGNATVVGDMTGAQIMEIVNHGAEIADAASSPTGVIQPAGLKYKYYAYQDANPGPQPYAWGAYDVTVRNKNTGLYEPLVMTKTYRVGTNEFLAPAGGDNYFGFKYMTNVSYWGDMLNAVNAYVTANYPITSPYKGPNNDGTLDGRIIRNGSGTYNPADPTQVVPVTLLHHNDPHGRLLDYVSGATTYPGYTRLATLIKQERAHNPSRTLLFNAGDTIQGDAMAAYYKAAFTGLTPDNQTLPPTLTVNPILKSMNAMTYTAMTLGNHEFNYGNYVFTGTLGQATFPLLQANLYDNGAYGIAQVNVRPYVTVSLPGPSGTVNLAVLGIGNHRIPNYELPSNIPGLTFTNPVTETQNRAPALQTAYDAVVGLTHIGFTTIPGSLEVDNNVDTYLAANTTGLDAIIGGHSHTNPSAPDAPYKFLPTFVGAQDNVPVIINQAYRYNSYLGEVMLGLLPKAGGGYDVVARAGRYIANSTSIAEDPTVKAIIQPYDDFFQNYKNRQLGQTLVPIDTLNAFITETNGANLQVDASLYKLNTVFGAGTVMGHLSGAMTNAKIAATATATNPVTMTVADMFTLMPYENSLVVYRLTGPQLKTILERAYRNYWYYKYGGSSHGGYSYYTTCMLDVTAGGVITYTNHDPLVYSSTVDHVGGLSFGNVSVDFLSATTYYTVSTVNYIAAGSCNFNNGGVTLWPFDQIVYDTQYYVRDVMIDYVPTLPQPIAPVVENRIRGIP